MLVRFALAPLFVAAAGLPLFHYGQHDTARDNCLGNDCLIIEQVHVGTRCGTPSSQEVDIRNAAGASYLRGYVVRSLNSVTVFL